MSSCRLELLDWSEDDWNLIAPCVRKNCQTTVFNFQILSEYFYGIEKRLSILERGIDAASMANSKMLQRIEDLSNSVTESVTEVKTRLELAVARIDSLTDRLTESADATRTLIANESSRAAEGISSCRESLNGVVKDLRAEIAKTRSMFMSNESLAVEMRQELQKLNASYRSAIDSNSERISQTIQQISVISLEINESAKATTNSIQDTKNRINNLDRVSAEHTTSLKNLSAQSRILAKTTETHEDRIMTCENRLLPLESKTRASEEQLAQFKASVVDDIATTKEKLKKFLTETYVKDTNSINNDIQYNLGRIKLLENKTDQTELNICNVGLTSEKIAGEAITVANSISRSIQTELNELKAVMKKMGLVNSPSYDYVGIAEKRFYEKYNNNNDNKPQSLSSLPFITTSEEKIRSTKEPFTMFDNNEKIQRTGNIKTTAEDNNIINSDGDNRNDNENYDKNLNKANTNATMITQFQVANSQYVALMARIREIENLLIKHLAESDSHVREESNFARSPSFGRCESKQRFKRSREVAYSPIDTSNVANQRAEQLLRQNSSEKIFTNGPKVDVDDSIIYQNEVSETHTNVYAPTIGKLDNRGYNAKDETNIYLINHSNHNTDSTSISQKQESESPNVSAISWKSSEEKVNQGNKENKENAFLNVATKEQTLANTFNKRFSGSKRNDGFKKGSIGSNLRSGSNRK